MKFASANNNESISMNIFKKRIHSHILSRLTTISFRLLLFYSNVLLQSNSKVTYYTYILYCLFIHQIIVYLMNFNIGYISVSWL